MAETTRERDDGDRRGVDGLTRRLVEHAKESGRPVSEDAARRQAAEVARLTNAQRNR